MIFSINIAENSDGSMADFIIRTKDKQVIRFICYDIAPVTTAAFLHSLPFTRTFLHARISGPEIWIDDAPVLDISQENASVFAEAGEIVIAPLRPERNKIKKCMGIFYGEGKLVDCGNIFGKVMDDDLPLLKTLGDAIWKQGIQELTFEKA
jgi:Protein of unknown function (DUF3830)